MTDADDPHNDTVGADDEPVTDTGVSADGKAASTVSGGDCVEHPYLTLPRVRRRVRDGVRLAALWTVRAGRAVTQMMRWAVGNVAASLVSTLTVIVATGAALSMWGAGRIVEHGVGEATTRWQGGVEMIVFFQPGTGEDVLHAAGVELGDDPRVARSVLFDSDATWEEFTQRFDPEVGEVVRPEDLPMSWRVVPATDVDAAELSTLADQWRLRDDVFEVVTSDEALAATLSFSHDVTSALQVLSWVAAGLAVMLIVSAAATSARTRREELAVLRAAGVSLWVLRTPFVLEGAVRGLIAASLSAVAVWRLRDVLEEHLYAGATLEQLEGFDVPDTVLWSLFTGVFTAGVVGSAVVSGVACRRWTSATLDPAGRWRWALSMVQSWLTLRWWDKHQMDPSGSDAGEPVEVGGDVTTTERKTPPPMVEVFRSDTSCETSEWSDCSVEGASPAGVAAVDGDRPPDVGGGDHHAGGGRDDDRSMLV